ncbi:MAG: protein kinase [Lentisphaeria bacterium]|nr:protein kinase [Lentisphaeria bacterium]
MTDAGNAPGEQTSSVPGVSDNEATLIAGTSPEDISFTPLEMRQRLGLPDDERMSNYNNLHPIGLGGVGAVYSGREPGTNREVAIKILRPQYRYSTDRIESFVQEARTTAQIDHPNVVPVYRFGVFDNEGVFFSMKRVQGETLRNVLRKLEENRKGYARKYTLRRLVDIFLAACNGVAFANKNGILHGDLKPGNIMIGEFGEVLVMDWGMARYRPELDTIEGRKKIRLGSQDELRFEPLPEDDKPIGGTPVFMAPEHLTGQEKNLTESSEVYSLGTILYSILTWKMAPYDTDQPREKIVQQVVRGRFISPRRAGNKRQTVPRELEAICCKAMAREPRKRYKNVSEMVEEIQNYLDGYPVRAYSPSPLYHLGKWLFRHPLIPVTLVTLILGVGGFKAYTVLVKEAEDRSRFRLAEYNANRAFDYASTVRNSLRKLRHGDDLEYDERFRLFRSISRQAALMANSNAMALASLSLLPRTIGDANSPRLVLAREIFRSAVALYREIGEQSLLQEAVDNYRKRWGTLFLEVLQHDPELLRLITLTEAHSGFLKIELPADKKWQVQIRTLSGKIVDIKGKTLDNLQLAAQDYVVRFTSEKNESFTFPVRVSSSKSVTLAPGFPDRIPENMCYVGAGEIPVHDLLHSRAGGDVPPFFIARYEVSIGEYLKFWHALPAAERLKHIPVTSISRDGTPARIWDAAGMLRAPYREELPVTGISAASAEAYCRWLGKQLGLKITLPTIAQWRKAAFFADPEEARKTGLFYTSVNGKLHPAGAPVRSKPQDVSVFGVVNTRGNVREMLANSRGRTNLVIGGSFLTSGSMTLLQRPQFTISGDNDIGFRFVADISPSSNR